MMIKSDGCPKNKITGIKGGGHRLRYGTNKQCAEYVAVVPVQHNDFLFTLDDYWDFYTEQATNEKKMKKIDSM